MVVPVGECRASEGGPCRESCRCCGKESASTLARWAEAAVCGIPALPVPARATIGSWIVRKLRGLQMFWICCCINVGSRGPNVAASCISSLGSVCGGRCPLGLAARRPPTPTNCVDRGAIRRESF